MELFIIASFRTAYTFFLNLFLQFIILFSQSFSLTEQLFVLFLEVIYIVFFSISWNLCWNSISLFFYLFFHLCAISRYLWLFLNYWALHYLRILLFSVCSISCTISLHYILYFLNPPTKILDLDLIKLEFNFSPIN